MMINKIVTMTLAFLVLALAAAEFINNSHQSNVLAGGTVRIGTP